MVLGGGGPVGYAFHAGVLAALADAGADARRADLVVGTSIGAVTAGLLRAGMAADDLHARVAHRPLSADGAALLERAGGWPSFPAPGAVGASRWGAPASPTLLRRLLRHPDRLRPGLLVAAAANAGTVDATPISSAFDRLFGDEWPAGTWVCAVDLDAGRRVVFGRPGSQPVGFGTAVAASCAVPTYFRPVEIGGRRYVDGGVRSPANTDVLTGLAADLSGVVVSLPMGLGGPPGRRGLDLPGRRLNSLGAVRGLAAVRAAGVPVAVFAPTGSELALMHYDAFDMGHLAEIAGRSRATTATRLAAGDRADAAALAGLAEVASPAQGT